MNTDLLPPQPLRPEREIRIKWNGPQARAMQSDTLYLDLEGAIRAGKTTVGVWKVITALANNPGMHALLCRWTGDSLDAQLKPRFWELCPPELLTAKPWNGSEEYVSFANGSRCYIRAIKTSEGSAKFSKISGLTLAMVLIDQPEEIPEKSYYDYLKGRLSQVGHPRQMILLPNPPEHHHWLALEFPKEGKHGNKEMITIATADNAANLPDGYVEQLMEDYPLGHPMRARLLFGKRGPAMTGEAIYGSVFKPEIHVREQQLEDEDVLLRGWDFGHSHPAVMWAKMTKGGGFRVLGVMQGRSEFLEDFVPKVLARERELFGGWLEKGKIMDCCDPTGAQPTSHGTKRTAVMILQEFGIYPLLPVKGNDPQTRDYAIQTIAKLMLRLLPEGPAYQVAPDCISLREGNSTGYVWHEKLVKGILRVPKKDGFYDHLQNCQEYLILTFYLGGVTQDTEDEDEDQEAAPRRGTNRAGY